jgi:glycosyltransferase involved in cell wall biosynthesis
LKIAFVLHPGSSVYEWPYVFTRGIATCLAESCDVIVYRGADGARETITKVEGVRYRSISIPANPTPSGLRSMIRWLSKTRLVWRWADKFNPDATSFLWNIQYASAVAKDLKAEHCDIVHVHDFSHFAPIIRWHSPRTKVVLHMHTRWLTRMNRSVIRRLRWVALIIGCSEYVTQAIRAAYPRVAKRCRTVHCGASVFQFSPGAPTAAPRSGASRLLFVGRISPEKGIHILVEALQQVAKRVPEAQLEIVGPTKQATKQALLWTDEPEKVAPLEPFYDGTDYFSRLKEKIASLGLTQRVTFAGSRPNSELGRYYRAADVYVQPSFIDTFGIPLVEAMASGVPVVASRAGGIPEVVEDGVTGLLVEPGNSSALAEAIIRLLLDEELRRSMGNAGRKRAVMYFSFEKAAETLLRHYHEITTDQGGKRWLGLIPTAKGSPSDSCSQAD